MLITRFKTYSTYKPSDVEWMGEIPVHWDVKRLKFVASIEAGQSPPSNLVSDDMDGLPFLQGNAEFGPVSPSPRFVCEQAPKKCSAGDILLSVRAPVGALNIAERSYGIGRGLCAIHPSQDLVRRFTYFLLITIRSRLNEMATGSTYDAVTTGDVGNLRSILPPLAEQRAIAAFLDRETAKIDFLVAKKERLIELLREKRTALISRAVTKGLDPDVPMKDSGVEWLQEIPAHWDVKRLKHLLRARLQYGANEPSNHIDPDSPRYIRITDIREDGTLRAGTKLSDLSLRRLQNPTFSPKEMSCSHVAELRLGKRSSIIRCGSWGKAAYAGYLVRARLDDHTTEPGFVEYW